MDDPTLKEALNVAGNAEKLLTKKEVDEAIDRIAEDIKEKIKNEVPILLCVMKGGLLLTSELLQRIQQPLALDYVHVDRYRNKTQGGSIHWHKEPEINLNKRLVLIVDDIFDEGYTLQDLITYCTAKGASKVLSVVLLKKVLEKKHTDIEPDIVGLEISDRYVFGWGMDYKGYWRNLTDVFAVSEN